MYNHYNNHYTVHIRKLTLDAFESTCCSVNCVLIHGLKQCSICGTLWAQDVDLNPITNEFILVNRWVRTEVLLCDKDTQENCGWAGTQKCCQCPLAKVKKYPSVVS